ncbi:MAG TPA: exopolyphosphatase [Lachnospiraceae bacterium]|nr:exopolyphosphatase [uncultured Lachnoclostridium sp.]HAU84142.1 exopolyphosphatase [Lachnospiraceae bacterium]
MAFTTFAAIDVGSNELSLKIFQISKKNGIEEVEHVRHATLLGSDSYKYKKIRNELVNDTCEVLIQFSEKMKEYGVTDYTAYATSAIREASNSILILDQIKLRSGIKVKILSNSEQRFLCYKAIALKVKAFQKIIEKGTAIVDVGSGSIQISLFQHGYLTQTQNIMLGSLRIRELLSSLENKTDNYHQLISEYIDNEMITFSELFLNEQKIEHIIATGDQLNLFMNIMQKNPGCEPVSVKELNTFFKTLLEKPLNELSEHTLAPREQVSLLIPTAMMYHKIFEHSGAKQIYFTDITLCDGIAAEYAERKEKIQSEHDFNNDIIRSASYIAARYHCNPAHNANVSYLALSIFDSIRKLHGLGKRERLLLEIAVILHSCGDFIDLSHSRENSYNIIMSTEIIGLSHQEREMVAQLVRCTPETFPKFSLDMDGTKKDVYIKLSKLFAIFSIANALDKSHKQKFSDVKISLKQNILMITTNTVEDITLEYGLFDDKANFFEEVYGIKPCIKQKRRFT